MNSDPSPTPPHPAFWLVLSCLVLSCMPIWQEPLSAPEPQRFKFPTAPDPFALVVLPFSTPGHGEEAGVAHPTRPHPPQRNTATCHPCGPLYSDIGDACSIKCKQLLASHSTSIPPAFCPSVCSCATVLIVIHV